MMTVVIFIIVMPFVGALFSMKEGKFHYGYSFFELDLNSVLLVTLAIAMTITVWNAFEFEKYPNLDIRQYFKPKQVYDVLTSKPVTDAEFKDATKGIEEMRGWKLIRSSDKEALFSRMNYLMRDRVHLELMSDRIRITSRPRWKILLVDMARNYRNVLKVGEKLKHLK